MRWIWWAVLAVALLAGCAEQRPRLVVAPDRLELAPGEEETLNARLDGLTGEVVWHAEHGTIVGEGLTVTYRAPDYPVEDVVTVTSQDDPRLQAVARVIVSAGGELGPRLEVIGDQALVFTRVGEQRRFRVRVFDAAGKPLADATPTFASADPEAFSISEGENGEAVVTALNDDVQSVELVATWQGHEARATAVFARLQPDAVRLDAAWIRDAVWQDGYWSSVVLERTPETEALQPGDVFYSGDAAAVWGRVDAVELGDDTLTLIASPARLEEIFSELDYRAETPPLQLRASWRDGRLQAEAAGEVRSSHLERCPGLEAAPAGGEELSARAAVTLRVSQGSLQQGELRLFIDDSFSSAAELRHEGDEAACSLGGWRARAGRLSILLGRLEITLDSSLGVFASGPGAAIELPETGLRTRARAVLAYQNGVWQPRASAEQQAAPPAAAPRVSADDGGELEAGLEQRLGVELRLLLPGQDAYLGRVSYLSQLPWRLELPVATPGEAAYQGSRWELERRLTVEDGQTRTSEETVARSPRVWLETNSDPGRGTDLGSLASEAAVRFSFGSRPRQTGVAEVWVAGGACEEAEGCFDGELRKLGEAELPGGEVVWRPGKADRGVWVAYARLREDDLSQRYPYRAEPRVFVITGPDLSELPLDLTLRGRPGGPALGVLSYLNRPLFGVNLQGERVQLTSPLQVWIPANGISAEPASLTVPAGRRGYQQVSLECPKTARGQESSLHLYSNDPEMAEVILPVRVSCDAEPPQPLLVARPAAGVAPLAAELSLGVAGAGEKNWCRLDFGDGGEPLEWPAGECPRRLKVRHLYEAPGSYTAVFLIGDELGERALARAAVDVK